MQADELYHYGRRGMKWYQNIYGKKNTGSGSAGGSSNKTTNSSKSGTSGEKSDNKKHIDEEQTKKAYRTTKTVAQKVAKNIKQKINQKKLSNMTDDELRKRVERMQMEERYRTLQNSVSAKTKGKEFAIRCLERIGENMIVNLGTQAANHIIGNAINKRFGVDSSDVMRRVVNPQKGQSDKK